MNLGDIFGHITRPGGDRRIWTTGTVEAVDDAGARLEVMVDGALVELPRVDGDYAPGDSVVVLRDPDLTGAGQMVVGTIAAVREPLPISGTVKQIPSGSSTIVVTTDIGDIDAQFVGSVLSVGTRVALVWNEGTPLVVGPYGATQSAPATPGAPELNLDGGKVTVEWPSAARAASYRVRSRVGNGSYSYKNVSGRSTTLSIAAGRTLTVWVQAINSSGSSGWSASRSVSRPSAPKTETVKTTIKPSASGTYRDAGGWDRWNTGRYGGRTTLYQGSGHGSGPLKGWAGYGNKVKNLGAVEITKIVVLLRGAGLATAGSGPAVSLQGSPHGSRPGGKPSSSGSTASGTPKRKGTAKVTLPSNTYEAWRTGGIAGLCTVGSGYEAVLGAGSADGMSLEITYKKRV